MKKIQFKNALFLMFVMSCLLVTTQIFGQERQRRTPEERAKMLTDKMKSELTLTDAQYKSVYDINLKYAQKNEDLKNSTQSREDRFSAMKASQEAKDKELKNVLSDEQYTKYQQMKDQMKDKAKKHSK